MDILATLAALAATCNLESCLAALHAGLAVLARCDLHLVLYAAFGSHFLQRALLAARERRSGEAREHAVHGAIYLALGLL